MPVTHGVTGSSPVRTAIDEALIQERIRAFLFSVVSAIGRREVMWKYYALLSAFFAALTAIFAKVGVKNINSDLATAIRTSVILLITWGIVFSERQVVN